jgi:hypothetical protein
MKLILKFGLTGTTKQVYWGKDLMDFPKLIRFDGKRWEWSMYDGSYQAGYELIFGPIPTYDPNNYADMPSYEEMFELGKDGCVCGAHFSSFKWDHLRYCGLWKPW